MSAPIQIVPISLEHIESFWLVLDLVARERVWLSLAEAPPVSRLTELVQQDMELNNPIIVALAEKSVVGWCSIIRETRQGRSHRGKLAMGVHPKFRNMGIGRKLLETSIVEAERNGIGRIELDIYAHNPIAKALYETCGFQVEGCRRMTRRVDGRYFDTINMARLNPELLRIE